MLSAKVKKKLESLKDLPSIPIVLTSVLSELDNMDYDAKKVASKIEQDQGLTAKILQVANSPYYGSVRKISTIDVAIVLMGANEIRDIIITLMLRKVFQRATHPVFNIKAFWRYSVFCGVTARYIARKIKYRPISEAFVAGLMHDIGIIILMSQFRNNFAKACRIKQENENISFIEAEQMVFEYTHSDVGEWLIEKWNLPDRMANAAYLHHISHSSIATEQQKNIKSIKDIEQPLTAIVSAAEWLSFECGIKEWDMNGKQPDYYMAEEILPLLADTEIMDYENALAIVRQEVMAEFDAAIKVLVF